MELTSSYTIGPTQADGRFYVSERHETADGRVIAREWLSDGTISPDVMLEEHAQVIKAKLVERAAAQAFAAGIEVPRTKHEFLSLFTAAERIAIRAEAKVDPIVNDFIEMMSASGGVYDSLARPGIDYLASIGKLTAERAANFFEAP